MASDGDGNGFDDVPRFLRDLADGARRMREAAEPTIRKLNEDAQRVFDAAADDVQRVVDAAAAQGARWAGEQEAATPPTEPAPAAAPTQPEPYDALLRVRAWIDEHAPLTTVPAGAMRSGAARAYAGNWAALDDATWAAVLERTRADDPLPLAWVAPTHVIPALLAAGDDAAQDARLEAATGDLASAARSVLASVTLDELQAVRATLEEAWSALEAGLPRPARAAATAALDELASSRLDVTFPELRESLDAQRDVHAQAWPVSAVRMRSVWGAAGVQHGDGGQTAASALRTLVAATAAARELQFVLAQEWRIV